MARFSMLLQKIKLCYLTLTTFISLWVIVFSPKRIESSHSNTWCREIFQFPSIVSCYNKEKLIGYTLPHIPVRGEDMDPMQLKMLFLISTSIASSLSSLSLMVPSSFLPRIMLSIAVWSGNFPISLTNLKTRQFFTFCF